MAPVAVQDSQGEVVGANLGALVRRLVLFEEVVLDSYAMRELPSLIEALGPEPFVELLDSKALAIRADGWTFGEIGGGGLVPGRGSAPLPLLEFSLAPLVPADREHHMHLCLGEVREMGLPTRVSQRVRRAIVNANVGIPADAGRPSMDALSRDAIKNLGLLEAATRQSLRKRIGDKADAATFSIRIEEVDERVLRAETDIGTLFGLTDEEVDKVVEGALLAIGGLNQRFEEMRTYNAVAGFQEGELSIVEEKVRYLIDQVDPGAQEDRFGRIVTLAGLPDPETAAGSVDVEKLLEVRQSEECREFRQWLRSLDRATDQEIEKQLGDIREKISQAVHSSTGKAVRLATTTGIGFVPVVGPIAGIALGALDQFAVDKLLPEPGPVSFLGSGYRSIFRG
jgi:hypothetical protein